ncbi:hypothetical protein [Variovorax sp. KK3]|uniref:hypothetical protein n=1 Tax=Variovorax sp. KK3 TaxID=1855728 RepID=UPI0015C3506B|nr:hypothetical protein [Variovorax sp. KK3]
MFRLVGRPRSRLRRVATAGVLGDYKSAGKGVGELRIEGSGGLRFDQAAADGEHGGG